MSSVISFEASAKLSPVLSAEDIEFIKDISSRFPERSPPIYDRFISSLSMDPKQRVRQAFSDFRHEPRTGLLQRGLYENHNQSVYEHSLRMRTFIIHLHKTGAFTEYLEGEDEAEIIRSTLQKSMIHDLPEVLTSDFTPTDLEKRITRTEKTRLEELAAKVLFQGFPDLLEVFHSYEEKKGKDDFIVKMADIFEWAADAVACYANTDSFQAPPEESLASILGNVDEKARSFPTEYGLFGKKIVDSIRQISDHFSNELSEDYPNGIRRRDVLIYMAS